jgi:hypothetical protein
VKQNIIDAWPRELARRLKRAPDYDWSRQRGTPYRFEKLPDGAETHQPPDWWVELRYKNWLNARKRRNQRFSKPPKWEEMESTEVTPAKRGPDITERDEEDEEQPGNWGPPKPKAQHDPLKARADNLRYLRDKLASVGIMLEKPYNEMKPDEIENVWLEYERRVRERTQAA